MLQKVSTIGAGAPFDFITLNIAKLMGKFTEHKLWDSLNPYLDSSNIFVPVNVQPVALEVHKHGHVGVLTKLGVYKHISVKIFKIKLNKMRSAVLSLLKAGWTRTRKM
jgi:hypothetical protein